MSDLNIEQINKEQLKKSILVELLGGIIFDADLCATSIVAGGLRNRILIQDLI